MKKAFKSKIGFLLISILLILVSAEAYMIYTMTIAGIIAVGVLIIFFVYMYMDTLYVLTSDKKLKIKSGFFFHREIYIKSIRKVRPVRHLWASPALSSDRLEISYNRYGRIFVSPTHKSEFIKELKEVNPRHQGRRNKLASILSLHLDFV
jgi:hypothetical protein